jgi:hypothetical protein
MGAFITQISNTSSLCITRMHTAIQFTNPKQIKVKYISIASNCKMSKKMVMVHSVDYAATHVGEKYPSLQAPIVYRSP